MLLNSHLIGEVERVCDRVVILDKGQVAASGTLAELLGRHELRMRLDGVSDEAEARLAAAGRLTRSGDAFTVALPVDPDPAAVPDLVADLVALGVRVHAVEPARISLEDRLLDILRHDDPAHREEQRMTARIVFTIAALTLREAARRRVLRSLAALTFVLLALSAWGFSRLNAEFGGLTSGEARLAASMVLNLVMFGLSLIAALGTAFLAGPTVAGEIESGIALAVLGRPIRRSAVLLGKWLGLVVVRRRFRGSGRAGPVPHRADHRRLLAAAAGDRAGAAGRSDGGAAHPGSAAVHRGLADGVGDRGGRAVRRDLDRGRGGCGRRGAGERERGAGRHGFPDAAAH